MHGSHRVAVLADRVVVDGSFSFGLVRTDRVERDEQSYPLPAHNGALPVKAASAYASAVPARWIDADVVFAPAYPAEAFWIDVEALRPAAALVVTNGRNAVTGGDPSIRLTDAPQNYIVSPPQQWLDGVVTDRGHVKQFVADPAVQVDERSTAPLRVYVMPPRPGTSAFSFRVNPLVSYERTDAEPSSVEGGLIRQTVLADPFGCDTWDVSSSVGIDVFFVAVDWFTRVTGEAPPPPPAQAPVRV